MLLHNAAIRDMDRITARVSSTAARTAGCRLAAYRDGDSFVIDIDLPGVDPAAIDFVVDNNVLTVRAERKRRVGADTPAEQAIFSRQVVLADTLDVDHLDAGYDNGVLTLKIPVLEMAA